jgi:hypothetical protein
MSRVYLDLNSEDDGAEAFEGPEDFGDVDPQGVARTILQQLGGAGRLVAMIGLKQALTSDDGVSLRWKAKAKDGINHVEITLASDDTYKMAFWKIRGGKTDMMRELEDIYADRLVETFERETGLYLSLSPGDRTVFGDDYIIEPEKVTFDGDDYVIPSDLADPAPTKKRRAKCSTTCSGDKAEYPWLRTQLCVQHTDTQPVEAIRNDADVSRIVHKIYPEIATLPQEQILVLALDSKNKPQGLARLFMGGLASSNADIATILRTVLMLPARAFILIHNHPSGNPEPSNDDKNLTRNIQDSASLVGLKLLDHVIVTPDPQVFQSFTDLGIMP